MPIDEENPPRRLKEAVAMPAASDASLPPHALDTRWYTHVDGHNNGPYTGHEIKRMVESGQILASDFLCRESSNAWTHARNEPLLGGLFRARAQAAHDAPAVVSTNAGAVPQVASPTPTIAQAALQRTGEASKSPATALLLSLLMLGIDQISSGHVGRGILMLVGGILAWICLVGGIVWMVDV